MDIYNYKYQVDYTWLAPKIKTDREYDLLNPNERKIFFNKFFGKEIENIREYLKNHTFICYAMSPKMAGKGTYLGLLREIIGEQYFTSISVGDLLDLQTNYRKNGKESETYKYILKNHRAYIKPDELMEALLNRDTKTVCPTELALIFLKKEIDKLDHQTILLTDSKNFGSNLIFTVYA